MCVDAQGRVVKKELGGMKHKFICYHGGKAYHSDVMDADVEEVQKGKDMVNINNRVKQEEDVGGHNA